MTLFRPSDDDYKEVIKETENFRIKQMEEERERVKKINEALRMFEPLLPQINNDTSKSVNKQKNIIEEITEYILNTNRFLTIEESKEILYYDSGAYVKGGEILIEKIAENMLKYRLHNTHLTEIKGHIMRKTYYSREKFDADVNIKNMKNGLYNVQTGELKEHTPEYLSISQVPINYNPNAKPKLFGKFLRQTLYSEGIREAVELMAYTFYRDNPFEIITKLFGTGANGKSVFVGLLTALHGTKNVSNVTIREMQKDPFALSDLENKYVNIDTELSTTTIYDTMILKKLTGRQPIRIQRKNKDAYDATLFAKLFFSTNKILETGDESDAYYRRERIIGFPNRFEDGDKRTDPNLLRKLSKEEELSGIFNVLMIALRTILRNGRIYTKEKTIEQRREKHELAVDPNKILPKRCYSGGFRRIRCSRQGDSI